MSYRLLEMRARVGDDSSLDPASFDVSCALSKSLDLEECCPKLRVGPADSQAQVSLGTITQGYAVAVFSDYPVIVRFNGSGGTALQLTSCNVSAVSYGAPLPYNCALVMTAKVTSVWLEPISGATQTANVRIAVTGDPVSAYV